MRHLILAALAVILVAACGAGTSSVPPAGGAAALAGHEFWSTAVQGHDLAPDTRVRIAFNQDGTLGAGAGCNAMGGTWAFDGTTLVMKIAEMTEMACQEDRMAQDAWLVDWLASGLAATVDGDELVLMGGGLTMTLLDREVADPDRPFEGTTWVLDALQIGAGADGVVSSVPSSVRATIRLEGGQLAVDTGCNTGTATATVDGDNLTIGPLALTKRACEPDPTQVERLVMQILQGTVTVAVDGPTLRLTGADGGLMFRAE